MFAKASSLLQKFRKSERGTSAILFAVSAIPLILGVGLAIDCARIFHVERKLTGAIDAAVLAAAKSLRDGASDAAVTTVANNFFSDNMLGAASSYVHIRSVAVNIDRAGNAVTINVDSEVKMVIFQIAGPSFAKVDLPKTAVARFDVRDIEIGLQLDVTGSMNNRAGGDPRSKIDALKGAVGDLVDIMFPAGGTTNRVRIGLAPFSAGVNAGVYAGPVSGGRSLNGCVYERLNLADQATDDAPVGALSLKAKSDLPTPASRRGRADLQDCPSASKVLPLSDDKNLIKRTVNSWTAGGSTAGQLGAAWAGYLISPRWTSIWPGASAPAPYNDGRTMKVAILMTDGIYNTVSGYSDGNDYGAIAGQSQALAQDTCDAMRAKGITIYTIGFAAPNASKDALRRCAGDASKFYDAQDGAGLAAAFRAIAEEINNLRLSS